MAASAASTTRPVPSSDPGVTRLRHHVVLYALGWSPWRSESVDPLSARPTSFQYRVLLYALFACAITTALASLLLKIFDLSNVIIVVLITVMLVALRWGGSPAR